MKAWLLIVLSVSASAQSFTQRGFLDVTGFGYPQTAPNDSGLAVGQFSFQYEAFYELAPGLRFSAGIDANADTHQQVGDWLHFSVLDRERLRPAFELRRLSLAYSRGKLTFEVGKQFIRWGRTDTVTPTDRFAPQDYLNPIVPGLLAVTAARLTYGTQANSIDLVYSPLLTPARIPLLNQRWANVPDDVSLRELTPDIPNGSQWGARFSHVGKIEYALSLYRGWDYFPLFRTQPVPLQPIVQIQRYYPSMQMYGGDMAIPLSFVTFKGEAAFFSSTTPQTDHYIVYVSELERQFGDWELIAGYSGQTITEHGSSEGYSVLRGYTKAFFERVNYTIDVNRSFTVQGTFKQDGQGVVLNPEYTQAFGQHWRVTCGYAWIHGSESDFIGQYHRNSFATLRIRYSF